MHEPERLTQAANGQGAEAARKPVGRARVKPRHLSPQLRQWIIDQFAVRQSTEDIAEELQMSCRTVTDVILLDLRRPPGRESGGIGLRRWA